jgi:hypothetical protein
MGKMMDKRKKMIRGAVVSCQLRNEYIRPPSTETPEKIAGNPRFDPYFKVSYIMNILAETIS